MKMMTGNFEDFEILLFCCSPYYHLLYINRAHAYMEVKNYRYNMHTHTIPISAHFLSYHVWCCPCTHRAAMSDGLRAVNLKPDDPSTHICYVMALHASKDAKRTANATTEFNERFPEEREELRRSLDKCTYMGCSSVPPSEVFCIRRSVSHKLCRCNLANVLIDWYLGGTDLGRTLSVWCINRAAENCDLILIVLCRSS